MKKSYVLIGLFLFFIIFITVVGGMLITGNIVVREEKDILLVQGNREVYFSVYGYSIDNPNIVVNPYGNSPLTALVMFETDDYSEVEVTIKSKDGNSDINYIFDKDKYHMIPIYGLYADYNNTVIIKSEGLENTIYIKTDKLPDDFMYIENSTKDNFMFYNSNYPYSIDNQGEVRWYLNSSYFGTITFIDNSNIIIGSDRYTEEGNTISLYKMNLLGKIYNEYLLEYDYYGYCSLYNDNMLVLSEKMLVIDIQTGEVIDNYIVNDNSLDEFNYNSSDNKHSFYNNTTNYNIVPAYRSGTLKETLVSDKRIALINYDRVNTLEDVLVERDVDRIKVTNNSGNKIYLILDKFMDKRIYEVEDVKYINTTNLNGKYTIYFDIQNQVYRTDYYIEV